MAESRQSGSLVQDAADHACHHGCRNLACGVCKGQGRVGCSNLASRRQGPKSAILRVPHIGWCALVAAVSMGKEHGVHNKTRR